MSEIIPRESGSVSQKKFAEMMQVSHTTVSRWMRRGMPHNRLGRQLVRIDPHKAYAWVKAQGALYMCGAGNAD